MYRTFYGLGRHPFEISPDPYFYCPTPRHNEAFAHLTYCVLRRKGFVVVTGEVGTGKTLLARFLLDFLDRNRIAFAYVYNPKLSVLDFLSHVLADLHVAGAGRTKNEILSHLNNYLIARSRTGLTTALVVDEAQLLSWELLEEIRLLTNLETSAHKLLQIVLIGQPELDRRLDSPQLRQLKQRVGLRCQLEPLPFEEVKSYVYRRLELAGSSSNGSAIFDDAAISAIHELSRGIPRVINNLCENSLISGYGKQAKRITAEIVRDIAEDLRIESGLAPPPPASSELDTRRLLARALHQVINELDGDLTKHLDETHLGPEAQTE